MKCRVSMSVGLMMTGVVSGLLLTGAIAQRESPFAPLQVLTRAWVIVENQYVDPVDPWVLMEGAVKGMAGALDPHTNYFDAEQYRWFSEDASGRFAGIGVQFEVKDGFMTVLSVFEGSPAATSGIVPGDQFIRVAGRPARDMRIEVAIHLMRGAPGTKINVKVRRRGVREDLAYELTRAHVSVPSVTSQLLADGVLYVKLRAFQAPTTQQLRQMLEDAVRERGRESEDGLRGVMLDLRDNGGGLLDQAVKVSDVFLDAGVIVSTRGRGGQVLQELSAHRRGTQPTWPMVVLVNAHTASASEIVAGALQDHHRAVLVGERTFGKGSVQSLVELPNGGAIKLTIARYFTPNGRSIQAQGIVPDVQVLARTDADADSADVLREENLDGHLAQTDSDLVDMSNTRETARAQSAESTVLDLGDGAKFFPGDRQAQVGHQLLQTLRGL